MPVSTPLYEKLPAVYAAIGLLVILAMPEAKYPAAFLIAVAVYVYHIRAQFRRTAVSKLADRIDMLRRQVTVYKGFDR